MQMKKRNGFTLVELVVVVAIIGILSMVVVPKFGDVTQKAKESTFQANHQSVVSAITMYQASNNGQVPTKDADVEKYLSETLTNLGKKPQGATYKIDYTKKTLTSTYDIDGSGKIDQANETLTYTFK